MANRPQLKAEKRTVSGKKVKKLRRAGFLPTNIYGKDVESLALQVAIKEFETVFKQTGETGLVDVIIDGQTRPVIIRNVQYESVSKAPLHADFYQVNMKEKVKTMVPLKVVGEPKAVTEQIGILMQPLNELEVEALPADLPEAIEAEVSHLAAIDDQILVSDLKIPQGVEVITDPSQVVVKIAELVTKEAEEEAAAEAAAVEAAKEETAEGEEANKEEVKESADAKATADKEASMEKTKE